MERKNISIKTYKREPQIWFGTEADSFSYDFVWHLPMQMYLDGDMLSLKREGNIPIFLNHQIVNEEKISIKNWKFRRMQNVLKQHYFRSGRKKNILKAFLFINVLQELYIREKRKRWKLKLRPGKKKCPEAVWHN